MATSDNDEAAVVAKDDKATLEQKQAGMSTRKRKRKEEDEEEEFKKKKALSTKKQGDDDALLESSAVVAETPTKKSEKRTWMDFYNKLVEFKKENGHTEVPQRYPPDPALGSFCKNQREYYKRYQNKKTSALTKERIALLNKIDFAWVSSKTKKRLIKDFDSMLVELKEFSQVHGHTRVPHVYPSNPGLGVFCHRVKIYYREMQQGKRKDPNDWLTPERIQALSNMQFEWKVGRWTGVPTWEERFQQLVEHKNRTGHINVSKEYDAVVAPGLKAWVANQRQYLSTRGSTSFQNPDGRRIASAVAQSEEKISSLKSLGMEFDRGLKTPEKEEDEDDAKPQALKTYNAVAL